MKTILSVLLVSVVSSAAIAQNNFPTKDTRWSANVVTVGGRNAPATLNQISSFLANQLVQNRNLKNISDSRLAVASFVNIDNLEETNRLGMALAENMMHEMHVRGFGVVDFKTKESLQVRQSGDFVFSRNLSELRKQYNVHYFLSGTLSRNVDGVVINARMIEADTGLIVSTAQAYFSLVDVQHILGEASRATTERIVIERQRTQGMPANMVNIN